LVGSFVKNWNLVFLTCEGWKGLQMSPNEYHEILGAQKFWVQWVLHMAKVGGAPRHNKMAWWGVLWKNEIRDFWDLRVGKAYKCPQMNTMKVLVHHHIARWLGGEFCEKMKFVIFEKWGLERYTNVPKWIPLKSWCTNVLSSVGFAHGEGWRCTTA